MYFLNNMTWDGDLQHQAWYYSWEVEFSHQVAIQMGACPPMFKIEDSFDQVAINQAMLDLLPPDQINPYFKHTIFN